MTDSGDVDLHLPLFDDAKVTRSAGFSDQAPPPARVGEWVRYVTILRLDRAGGGEDGGALTRSSPDALGANLLISVRQTDQKASRSVVVVVVDDANDLIVLNTQKRNSQTQRAGGKVKSRKKKKRCDRLPLPPPSAFARAASATLAPIRKRKEKKSDLIRSTKTPLFAVVPASQHVLRPH